MSGGIRLKKILRVIFKKLSRKRRFWVILFIAGLLAFVALIVLLIFQGENMKYVTLFVLFILFGVFACKVVHLPKVFPDSYPTLELLIVHNGQQQTARVNIQKESFRCGCYPDNDYILNIPCAAPQQFRIKRDLRQMTFVYTLSDQSGGGTYYLNPDNEGRPEVFSEKILREDDEYNEFIIGATPDQYVKLRVCLPE